MRRLTVLGFLLASSPMTTGVAEADGPQARAAGESSDRNVDAQRVPVVVELFSSEGCSSCPPADALLARLDRDQPIAGVEVVALEMHVDYWNYLGWSDPFSQAAFSARQRAYAGARGVYTPQMVVDGRDELVGSNAPGARLAIESAARAPHVAVKLARDGDEITIDVPAVAETARVMIATTERGLSTRVTAGENRGETLAHGPVVRTLRAIGDVGASGFHARVRRPPPAERAVVFVQARDSLHVLGAATL